MKKISFFHPANGSKSQGTGGQSVGNIHPQVPSGSPEGAPEERTGAEANVAEITRLRPDLPESRDYAAAISAYWRKLVEAGGLEPVTR